MEAEHVRLDAEVLEGPHLSGDAQVGLFVVQGLDTRVDFKAHVSLTMNRIPHQLAPAFAFLVVVLLIPSFRARRMNG